MEEQMYVIIFWNSDIDYPDLTMVHVGPILDKFTAKLIQKLEVGMGRDPRIFELASVAGFSLTRKQYKEQVILNPEFFIIRLQDFYYGPFRDESTTNDFVADRWSHNSSLPIVFDATSYELLQRNEMMKQHESVSGKDCKCHFLIPYYFTKNSEKKNFCSMCKLDVVPVMGLGRSGTTPCVFCPNNPKIKEKYTDDLKT